MPIVGADGADGALYTYTEIGLDPPDKVANVCVAVPDALIFETVFAE